MPFKKVEYSFPDEEGGSKLDIEPSSAIEVDLTGKKTAAEIKEENTVNIADVEDSDVEFQVEVIDDTPEADQNRKTSEPPEEVTDEELEDYSEKVRRRIKHFSKGYHDERRLKEQAVRERTELEKYAQQLVSENKGLKTSQTKNQTILLDQAKRTTEGELAQAKSAYKEAYEAGEADAVVEAQEKLTAVKIKADRLNNIQLPPLQKEETTVEGSSTTESAPVKVDERASEWAKANTWFGSDDEMTSLALGLHNKLVKQGISPQSDEYYEAIDGRMREVFPDTFGNVDKPDRKTSKRQANVVAPATRSTSPKKVVLTRTQVNLAKRLGVPLEDYAKQVAIETRKNVNG
jgi:hypothetical protein|tara:strand:- start:1375 stop:2415 length:1041 start_codon:yes stop_codon:yes gene_type:complete